MPCKQRPAAYIKQEQCSGHRNIAEQIYPCEDGCFLLPRYDGSAYKPTHSPSSQNPGATPLELDALLLLALPLLLTLQKLVVLLAFGEANHQFVREPLVQKTTKKISH